ncbi:MAG: universal stress protein [Candidatus Micrarchaeia archaeon]
MFKRIVVALDGSVSSWHALDKALELAKDCRGTSKLFGVSVSPVLEGVGFNRDAEKLEEYFATILRQAVSKAKRKKLKLEPSLLHGFPPEQIVEFAKKQKCDLVAMGNWGAGFRGDISRLILGSVSAEVIKRTGTPVLVVK